MSNSIINFDDFERHEVFSELVEKEDYKGLVKFCKDQAERDPDDYYAQYYLGDAYVLNGEFEKTIEFITPHLKSFPDNQDFQSVVLDALYKLGKSENDYDWIIKPRILQLNEETLSQLFDHLKPKRKPRNILELHAELFMEGYVRFSENELLGVLKKDKRFVVDSSDGIRVRRKHEI